MSAHVGFGEEWWVIACLPDLTFGWQMAPYFDENHRLYKITYPLVIHRHRIGWFRFYWWKIACGVLVSLILGQYLFGASVYNVKVINTSIQYLRTPYSISNKIAPTKSAPLSHDHQLSLATTKSSPQIVQVEPGTTAVHKNDTKEGGATVSSLPAYKLTLNSTINGTISSVLHHDSVVTSLLALSTNSTPALMTTQRYGLPLCPLVPPVLVGPIRVWFDYPSFKKLATLYPYLEKGGHGKPISCLARHKVAIVLPYRDRDRHLRGFLHNMHSLLTKQQLDYTIIVVEQIANQTFNRAKLMNVGFVEGMKLYNWSCFIFHDVDLYPEDDRNLYSCPEQPRHMSVAIDKFGYRLPYSSIFGGICAIKTDQFETMNGFSNDYWGWGGEDDDMSTRVEISGYRITRYPANIARYKMVKHMQETLNPVNKCRYNLMYRTKKRYKQDGISTVNYKVVKLQLNPVYTRITVDLQEQESKEKLRSNGICK